MTAEHAQAGFHHSALFPVNTNAIPLSVYALSKTTERPMSALTNMVGTESVHSQQSRSSFATQDYVQVEDSVTPVTANEEEVQPASEVITVQQATTASVLLTSNKQAAGPEGQTQEVIDCASAVGLPLTSSFLLEYSSEYLNEYSLIPEVL